MHKVFSSTFETIPTRRGVDPFRIAPAYAIGAGIHSIRASDIDKGLRRARPSPMWRLPCTPKEYAGVITQQPRRDLREGGEVTPDRTGLRHAGPIG